MKNKKLLLISAIVTVFSASANAEEVKLSNVLLNTTLSGDARINYYYKDDAKAVTENGDLRTRLRLNFTTKINDFSKIVGRTRLTSDYELGGNTVGGSTASSVLATDILYFDYKKGNHEILVGRFAPFYKISDFFVTDGEREGLGYVTKIANTDLKAGYLFSSDSNNKEIADKANYVYVQGVHNLKIAKGTLKIEATGIALNQEKGSSAKDSKGVLLGADYTQNLNSVVEFIQVRGQYVQTDNDGENTGNSIGVVLGSKSIAKLGDWKAEVEYKSAGKDNSLAKSKNEENVKLWAQTYVSPKMNLELEYNQRATLEGTKTVDYSTLGVSLNHSF